MEFDLSPEVVDQIIFAMEDQSSRSYVHCATGRVVGEARADAPEEFVAVPRWQPVDGFHLMESFVVTVRNPVYRDKLREALASGKGVFRNFKNTLKESHDLQRVWYRFKELEMRRVVTEWYNREREARGLERMGPEPEEIEDLTAADFDIVAATPEHVQQIIDIDRESMMELGQLTSREPAAYRERRVVTADDPHSHIVVALSPREEVVGVAWAYERPADAETELSPAAPPEWVLVQLAVLASFRRLGLGERLLDALTERAGDCGVQAISAELPAAALDTSELLSRGGYEMTRVVMSLAVSRHLAAKES